MTDQEIREAIQILTKASETITNLPSDFKSARGWYNLDYELDEIVKELELESVDNDND